MKRTIIIICTFVLLVITVFVFSYRHVVFQEGNPLPFLGGIIKLTFTKSEVIKVSEKPELFIEKSKSNHQSFIRLMAREGYVFNDQIGAGLIFEKDGSKVIAITSMFTRYYEVIEVNRNIKRLVKDSIILKEELPTDFRMIFAYGVGAKNKLDTFEGKYTMDMIQDPSMTVNFKLDKEQLQIIYNKMQNIDFFEYPSSFNPVTNGEVTPFQTYYFKVRVNGIINEIRWEDKHFSEEIKAKKLRELIQLITIMIQDSPEYKLLPQPRGGYD